MGTDPRHRLAAEEEDQGPCTRPSVPVPCARTGTRQKKLAPQTWQQSPILTTSQFPKAFESRETWTHTHSEPFPSAGFHMHPMGPAFEMLTPERTPNSTIYKIDNKLDVRVNSSFDALDTSKMEQKNLGMEHINPVRTGITQC